MRRWRDLIRVTTILLALGGLLGACKKSPPPEMAPDAPKADAKTIASLMQVEPGEVDVIMRDLQVWLISGEMTEAHQKAFEAFSRFLAIRYRFDRAVAEKQVGESEAVSATQPLIDSLAKLGAPMEDVLYRILEARKSMPIEKRAETACKEDPETFGTIILWTMKSKRAVPLLMELAKSKTHDNRRVFVRALGRIGDARASDLLRNLADTDLDEEVRAEAVVAIQVIEAGKGQEAKK